MQESLTIQQQLNFPLVINQVNEGKKLIFKIFQKLERVNPTLIYLFSSDPVKHFRETMRKRGVGWQEKTEETLENSLWYKSSFSTRDPVGTFILELTKHTEDVIRQYPFKIHRFNVDVISYSDIQKEILKIIKVNYTQNT